MLILYTHSVAVAAATGYLLSHSSAIMDFSLFWLPLCGISWPTYGGQKKSTRLLNIVLVFLVGNAWLKWRRLGCPNFLFCSFFRFYECVRHTRGITILLHDVPLIRLGGWMGRRWEEWLFPDFESLPAGVA